VPDPSTLAVFAAAALALLLVPGPAVLFVVTRSVEHGRPAALASVAGIHTGTLVHVAAAAFGISALLAASHVAYDAVRYGGAAYLVFLGVRALLRRGGGAGPEETVRPASRRRLLAEGFVVNVLNPKTALFFLAFLPQFVDRDHGSAPLQVLVLGALFVALGVCTDGTYALLSAHVGRRLRGRRLVAGRLQVVSGVVYIALGLLAAFGGPRPKRAAGAP
jgi:threonine/homoserine/homoserine lactone efflux protein